jgi:hypothetical protein
MRTRGRLLAALLATLAAICAGPALAHEEITPTTVPVGRPAFLTLTAANESSVDLVRIVLRAPAALGLGEATRSPAGWSAVRSGDTVTWTGGAVKPRAFESWGFEIESPDQAGTLALTVTLGYAGGKTDEHEVDIAAVAPTGGAASAPATSATTAAITTPAPVTGAPGPGGAQTRSDGDSGEGSGTANAALGASILALLVAAGALIAGRQGRGGPPGATGSEGPTAAQDW